MLAASSTASTPSSSDSCCNHLQAQGRACGAHDMKGRCQPSLGCSSPSLQSYSCLLLSSACAGTHRLITTPPQGRLACRWLQQVSEELVLPCAATPLHAAGGAILDCLTLQAGLRGPRQYSTVQRL